MTTVGNVLIGYDYDRFMAKVCVGYGGACWVWIGARNSGGYGQFQMGRRSRPAHRVAYEHFTATAPAGLDLDHLCRNRGCVNPDHLEPVTRKENVRRGAFGPSKARKTHCRRGHLLADSVRIDRHGRRNGCRLCLAADGARNRARVLADPALLARARSQWAASKKRAYHRKKQATTQPLSFLEIVNANV